MAEAVITIRGDTASAEQALASVRSSLHQTADTARVTANAFSVGLGNIAATAVTAFAAKASEALSFVSINAIKAASDMSESVNKVNVVFGESSGIIQEFANSAATNLGMSKAEALAAAGTFGGLFAAMEIGEKTSADMSKGLVSLASDLASFNNIEPTIALDKLRAGLVGETEPLRTLGVNLTAAAVEARALGMGFQKTGTELAASAKAQAAYSLILQQTMKAQGDFANTSTGMANAQRIITAQFKDFQVTVGEQLLPIIAPLVNAFATSLPDAMAAAADAFKNIITILFNLGKMVAANEPLMKGLAITIAAILTPAVWGAATGFIAMVAPIVGVGIVLGTLAAAIAVVIDHWSLFEQAGAVIMKVLGNVATWIKETTGPAFKWFGDVVGQVVGWIQNRLADLSEAVGPIAEKIGIDLSGVSRASIAMMPNIGAAFAGLENVAEQVGTTVGGTIAELVNNGKIGIDALSGIIAHGMEQLRQPIEIVGAEVVTTAAKFSDAGKGMADALDKTGKAAMASAKDIKEAVEATQEAILLAIGAKHAYDKWREGMKALVAEGQLEEVAQHFLDIGKTVGEAVTEILKMQDELATLAREVEQHAGVMGKALTEVLGSGVGSTLDLVRQGLAEFAKAEWIKSLEKEITIVSGQIHQALAQGLDPSDIVTGATALFETYKTAIQGVKDITIGASRAMADEAERAAASTIQWLIDMGLTVNDAVAVARGGRPSGGGGGRVEATLPILTGGGEAAGVAEAMTILRRAEAGQATDADRRRWFDLSATGAIMAQLDTILRPSGWGANALKLLFPFAGDFAHGGIVPGPIGAPVLATVHGGEFVSPPSDGSRSSGTVIINIGPVYGLDDLDRKIAAAWTRVFRQGGFAYLETVTRPSYSPR